MKILYTILFFADLLVLVLLTHFLLSELNARAGRVEIVSLISGLMISILLLPVVLNYYLGHLSRNDRR